MAAAIRDPDPVVFFEHKSLMATKAEIPDGEIVDDLGAARVVREGSDLTIAALALMVPRALAAAERLAAEGHLRRSHRPPFPGPARHHGPSFSRLPRRDASSPSRRILASADGEPRWSRSSPRRPSGTSTGPSVRITTPHIPLPAAAALEDLAIPSVDRIYETILKSLRCQAET